jgi:hypothetical protein
LRSGIPDARWSPAALTADIYDFVFLITTLRTLAATAVLTDGDAAASLTRFATTQEESEQMLRRMRDDETALAESEVLVADRVPFDSITLIGVANDRVRDRVREKLEQTYSEPKVAVYPPWFQPPAR